MAQGTGLNKKWNGIPAWALVFLGTTAVGVVWFLRLRKSKPTTPANATPTATPAASSDNTQQQVESIYATIRNLQGQETGFSNTASTLQQSLSGLSGQIAGIPSGPAGPAGPPGPPGPTTPPPRPGVTPLYIVSDGQTSFAQYASRYRSTVAGILEHTKTAEPQDSYGNTAFHRYLTRGDWTKPVPRGYSVIIPVSG